MIASNSCVLFTAYSSSSSLIHPTNLDHIVRNLSLRHSAHRLFQRCISIRQQVHVLQPAVLVFHVHFLVLLLPLLLRRHVAKHRQNLFQEVVCKQLANSFAIHKKRHTLHIVRSARHLDDGTVAEVLHEQLSVDCCRHENYAQVLVLADHFTQHNQHEIPSQK